MEAQYIVDSEGNRKSVVLPVEEYERLLAAVEELADIADYDETIADLKNGRERRTLRRDRGE